MKLWGTDARWLVNYFFFFPLTPWYFLPILLLLILRPADGKSGIGYWWFSILVLTQPCCILYQCVEHICLRIKSKDTFVWVVESCSFSYQRYTSVIKGHTIRELYFCIAILQLSSLRVRKTLWFWSTVFLKRNCFTKLRSWRSQPTLISGIKALKSSQIFVLRSPIWLTATFEKGASCLTKITFD